MDREPIPSAIVTRLLAPAAARLHPRLQPRDPACNRGGVKTAERRLHLLLATRERVSLNRADRTCARELTHYGRSYGWHPWRSDLLASGTALPRGRTTSLSGPLFSTGP